MSPTWKSLKERLLDPLISSLMAIDPAWKSLMPTTHRYTFSWMSLASLSKAACCLR